MTNNNIAITDPFEESFMDLETIICEADKVRISYTVLEMFAESQDGDIYIGSIDPEYANAFIAEFERNNNCNVWFNTMTYWL